MASVKDLLLSLTIFAKVDQAVRAVGQFTNTIAQADKMTAAWKKSAQNLAIVGGVMEGAAAAIALPLKASAGAYMDQQAELAHIAGTLNDGAKNAQEMVEVQKLMIDTSDKSAISALAAGDAYYIAKSNMLSHVQALEAVRAATSLTIATTKNAAEAQAEMMPTTRTLTELYNNFGGSLSVYADQMTKLQTQYSFASIQEVTNALSYAAPAAKAAGISVSEMMTSIGMLSAGGKYSAEAGTMFESFVDKLGSDPKLAGFVARTAQGGMAVQRTIAGLAAVFGSLPAGPERMRELAAAGFDERSAAALSIMIDKVSQFAQVNNDMANSAGTAGSKSALMMATLSDKMAVAANQWTNFKVLIGEALAPSIGTLVAGLGKVLEKLTNFAEHHKTFVEFAVLAAAGTAVVLGLAGAVALAAAGLVFMGVSAATALAVALPIAAAIGAVAAGAFLIYENWGAVVNYFKNINWRNVGMDILKGIGQGILSGLAFLMGPLGVAAGYIAKHFIGHSPPPLGPLHALNQVHIIETIAQSIRPGPMLGAIRRTAAAAAIAVPMAIGGAMPAAAATMHPGASAGAPIVINITIQNTINGNAADFEQAAEKHGYRLAEILHKELERRRRTDF